LLHEPPPDEPHFPLLEEETVIIEQPEAPEHPLPEELLQLLPHELPQLPPQVISPSHIPSTAR
jgi:hypothetical protein